MKRFLKFYQADKQFVKMINSTEKGFELVINSDSYLKKLLQEINDCEKQNDGINVVWQMKFKKENFILYKNCIFSEPMDNSYIKMGQLQKSKKLKVTCSEISFYSESAMYKDRQVKKAKEKYKDAMLLNRMLKIDQLELKNEEDLKEEKRKEDALERINNFNIELEKIIKNRKSKDEL